MLPRLVLAALATVLCPPARAALLPMHPGLSLVVESVTVSNTPTGVSGYFDVYFLRSGTAPELSAMEFELSLFPAASGLNFTSVVPTPTSSTPHPYVLPGSIGSFTVPPSGDSADVFAYLPAIGAYTSIDDHEGAARVSFTAAPAAAGTYQVSVVPNSEELVNSVGTPYTAEQIVMGEIVVNAVPEPSAALLVVTALAAIGLARVTRVRPTGAR